MSVWKLAWRNVWRNTRRTSVTVAAMAFGMWSMTIYSGLLEGYLADMEANILELELGDLQIFPATYRDDPSIHTRIDDSDALVSQLEADGFRATGRLLAYGLAAAGDSSAGVSFRGVDLASDATVTRVAEEVAQGEWLSNADPRGVVLGRQLARVLAVKPGDELLVFSEGADGSLAYDLLNVRGVLRGIGEATDRTGVFLHADAFRELMVVPDGVHQILVRRPEGLPLPEAAAAVAATRGQLDVKTWRELLPTLATMLDSARSMIYAVFFVVYIAIALLILNAMLMAVFERVREFGVMKALGVRPGTVMRMILAESAIQVAMAIAIGGALAAPALLWLNLVGIDIGSLAGVSVMGIAMDPIWNAEISANVILGPPVVLVLLVFIAVVHPALKAALIQPVDAIRYR